MSPIVEAVASFFAGIGAMICLLIAASVLWFGGLHNVLQAGIVLVMLFLAVAEIGVARSYWRRAKDPRCNSG